ncbi:MAG: hypothetical protein BGO72_07585 [Burkholderiales bacterium 70-64]|nr:MAG: hypothetical protein BGO72_07585 [Burkholderiales bacterium 70-64]
MFSVCNHTALAGSRVAVSLAALDLGASPFAVGLLLSFYGLLPMFLSVAGGRWIDRIGMRVPMLAGTGLLTFGVVVPFLGWDIGALYLASVTIGLGFMAFHLAVQKAAGVIGGAPTRKLNFSLLALGFSISGFIGPTLAGVTIDLLGHRAAFGLLALAPLAAWFGLRRYPFEAHLPHVPPPQPAAAAPGRVLDLLDTPELRRMYLSVTLLSSAWDLHQFLVPLYGAKIGLSASKIGLVLSAFALATFVVRLALPLITRRVAEWPLILAAMACAALVYTVYPFFPTLPAMIALSFALGLGLGTAQPMVMVVMHHAAPPARVGEAAGLRLTLINGTQTFLPSAFGAFGGVFGLASIFWGTAALVGAGVWYAGRGLRAEGRLGHAALRPEGGPGLASDDDLRT